MPFHSLISVAILTLFLSCSASIQSTSPPIILQIDGGAFYSNRAPSHYDSLRSFLRERATVGICYQTSSFCEISTLYFHIMMGNEMKVLNIDENTFRLQGTLNLPNNGDWESDWIQHPISIEIRVTDTGWTIDDSLNQITSVTPNHQRLDSLREQLFNYPDCTSKDWDIATDCFPLVQKYEYELFVRIVSGDTALLSEYLHLQQSYNIAYAGEFAEHYAGNIYYLVQQKMVNRKDMEAADIWEQFPFSHSFMCE